MVNSFNSKYRARVYGPNKYTCTSSARLNVFSSCYGCLDCSDCLGFEDKNIQITTNKRIYKTFMVPSSEYTMVRKSYVVSKDTLTSKDINQDNKSDRFKPHKTPNTAVVPSHGNSTKRSITRLRPGSMIPGGEGVDVKHNSYERYLAKKKGHLFLPGKYSDDKDLLKNKVVNNKVQKPSILFYIDEN